MSVDADYFRRLADRCYRLARSTHDLGATGQFRLLADEFAQKAKELSAQEFRWLPSLKRREVASETPDEQESQPPDIALA